MPPQTAQAELSILAPGEEARVLPLEQDLYELGRADTNALAFPKMAGLSRKHVAFERSGGVWLVRDLGSTNGTFVNGVRVSEPLILRSDDRIAVGDLKIVYSDHVAQTVTFIENPVRQRTSEEATLQGVLQTDEEMQGSPHMRALVQAGRELCGQTSLQELFEVIMNLSFDAVGAARGVLLTMEQGEFHVRASKGAPGSASAPTCGDVVFKERRSLLVTDALSDEALSGRASILTDQIRAIIALVPLQTEKRVIGLILS